MSQLGEEFPQGGGGNDERTDKEPKIGKKNNRIKVKKTNKYKYSNELRSRFGEAFLPFATRLESVEDNGLIRKRKGKNKKIQPNRITKLPQYNNNKENRQSDYNKQLKDHKKKLSTKQNRKETKSNEDRLSWKGDTMTFDEGWPNLEQRRTLRLFHINLNGITYHNELLEWEMTIAYLMDMQVDIFGLTEVNLDMNNGIVKDNIIQSGKHFDPYLRMTTSSSLQKVGKTPFKMGGTITGTNGCWSGRIESQGSDKLG